MKLAVLHYKSGYNPPHKAFDYYVAHALVNFMKTQDFSGLPWRRLFYSDKYGLTLVSEFDIWDAAMESYVSRIDTTEEPTDSDFIKTKKDYFRREISIMRGISNLPCLKVDCLSIP